MNTATDIDNRPADEVIAYQEARIEALLKRVRDLESENSYLRTCVRLASAMMPVI